MIEATDAQADAGTTPQPVGTDAQPFQLRGDPPRVMRLSRKALVIIGSIAGLGIGGSLIYALAPKPENVTEELYNTDSRATAETITAGPRDYGSIPKLGPPPAR